MKVLNETVQERIRTVNVGLRWLRGCGVGAKSIDLKTFLPTVAVDPAGGATLKQACRGFNFRRIGGNLRRCCVIHDGCAFTWVEAEDVPLLAAAH